MKAEDSSKPSVVRRCEWATNDLLIRYHDKDWGVPVHDDRLLFAFLILEGAQAGLSWETILKKRWAYRLAFDFFDATAIARYDKKKVRQLLANPSIVRNRLKIAAAIQNAKAFLAVQNEFGSFDSYIWQFVGGKPKVNAWRSLKDARVRRDEQGSPAAGIQVCGSHHLLCLHAGHRYGERPFRPLLSACSNPLGVCPAVRASPAYYAATLRSEQVFDLSSHGGLRSGGTTHDPSTVGFVSGMRHASVQRLRSL